MHTSALSFSGDEAAVLWLRVIPFSCKLPESGCSNICTFAGRLLSLYPMGIGLNHSKL
jgi:hypothetical protein